MLQKAVFEEVRSRAEQADCTAIYEHNSEQGRSAILGVGLHSLLTIGKITIPDDPFISVLSDEINNLNNEHILNL